ncbi:MAG TPA: Zn-dependent hydrolase [Coleofasciculaceae cyanobacterium]|jgi:N-carbamoyl-L-amino-acid hydrolase
MQTTLISVNGDRLNQTLSQLAAIGQLSAGGVCRLAYSAEDLQARQQVQTWMEDAGMTVRIDAAGNMIGRYPGQLELPALATGSHIDTVPTGGRYDGALGVLAGLEVVRSLHDQRIQLRHPLEVIVFTDEEGGMIGSKAMAGTAPAQAAEYRRPDGSDIQDCLRQIGGDWSQLHQARRTSAEIAAYVELHVEQGGILEAEGKQIGIVEGIVSLHRCHITVLGRPNHAGTTPMHRRRDAMVAAAQVVTALNDIAVHTPGGQVATIGYFNISPNAANIIPGRVEMEADIRDLSEPHIEALIAQLQAKITAIATATQTEITLERGMTIKPTLASPAIQAAIAQVCERLQLSACSMPSRAIHDAQEIGRFTEMGMIFIPSIAGVSHAEDEYSSPDQCIQGATVLLQTLLQLDTLM